MARDIQDLKVIPSLVQGISQQAAPQRRDAQCEAQWDCINSVLEGCVPRPHADLLKLWPGRDLDGGWFTRMEHEDENYIIGVDPSGTPFAIDLADGTDCTVTNTAPDLTYLTLGTGTPAEKLEGRAVDDYVFVTNRGVTVAMAATTSAAKVNEALVFVKSTSFGRLYSVKLSGPATLTSTALTGDKSVAPTQDIAEGLRSATSIPLDNTVTAAGGIDGVGGYSCDRYGSLLHIYRADGLAFDIITTDGGGDESMIAFNGTAPGFNRLPAKGVPGIVLEVKGDKRTGDDDYYVKFNGSPSTGQWDETVGPGVQTTLNAATMPHAFVNTGYRTFNFNRLTWSTRIAGDADTAKDPGFVGKQVRDILYHQRRLGLVYRAGVVFSKTDFPYTYFPDTLQTVLATAPVDLKISGSSDNGAASFDFGVQTNENLFLWAQGGQVRIGSGDNSFKQDTSESFPASAFEYSQSSRPVSVGGFLFFTCDVGEYATLRVQLFQGGRLAGDVDVTSHAAQYIPSGVHQKVASETLRYVFILSEGIREQMQLFNYTWNGEEFIQAAINTWRFPGGDILWAGIKSNYLFLLQQRPEGVALLRVDMTPGRVDSDAGATYLTRLDLRVDDTQVTGLAYDAVTNTSSFTLPYEPDPDTLRVVVREAAGDYTRGRTFTITEVTGDEVTVRGDITSIPFYVGLRIESIRDESEFFIRGDNGPEPVDRLVVDRFLLTCSKTSYTRVEVRADNWDAPKTSEFPQRVLGGISATTGAPEPRSGNVDIMVGLQAHEARIRLINDTFLPSSWQNAAYQYTAVGWKGGR